MIIIYAYCFPNNPFYFRIFTDHRGRMYHNGESNPINSKFIGFLVQLDPHKEINWENEWLKYYTFSQIKTKVYKIQYS